MNDSGCDLCGHRKKDHRGIGSNYTTLCTAVIFNRQCRCPRYFHTRIRIPKGT